MLDEFYVEKLIKKKFPLKHSFFPTGIGDDAAIVKTNSNKLVISCDSQVEGVHFDLDYFTPEEIAFRSVSVALSDLSAMGAKPKFFSNSLFIPKNINASFLNKLFNGFKKVCKFYNIYLLGGNVSKSKSLILDLTVIGEVVGKSYKERLNSKKNDFIYVSGNIGDASRGLNILKNKRTFSSPEKRLISKYKSPKAKVDLGIFLGQLKDVTSMIDITDGLALDLGRLIGPKTGGKGATIVWEDIPKSINHTESLSSKKLMKSVLNGGDDYELLFTVKNSKVANFEKLCKKNNFKVYRIGFVNSLGHLSLVKGGKVSNLEANGFIHKF